MQKIKAAIFDLDGTIANTLPLCIQAFRQSIQPLTGRSLTDEEIIATFGPSEEGTIRALAPDHYDRALADYLHYYEALHDMCPTPFEGMNDLLAMLKENKIPVAMVTGKGRDSTNISLKRFGMISLFTPVETGSPQGPRKPDGIRAVLREWSGISIRHPHGIDKEEVIYVGDAPSDIDACRETGVPVIAAAWAETAEPEKLLLLRPDELFYKIPDFAAWLTARITP